MDRYTIHEMIVVEGKNDTNTLKSWFDCDTIETNGSAVSAETIDKVRHALEKRGVIVFTDPDYPGEKIRRTIDREVPGCEHAFLPRDAAVDHRRNKIGIEHASRTDLMRALSERRGLAVSTAEVQEQEELLSRADLQRAGLIAGSSAKKRRELLGKELRIGYANGKQLYNRLKQFKVTKTDFEQALAKTEKEIGHL